MKKLIQISSMVVMLTGCCLNVNATSYIEETPEIVETTPITADPVKLLQEEVRYTRHWEGEFDDTIQLSYEDAQRLLKIAWAEAGNQGVIGQFLVMEVVYNRMLSDRFPDTIEGVISQSGQFQSYQDGVYDAAEPTWETHQALALLEKNKDIDYTIFAFENANNHSLEKYFVPIFQYGDHIFYTTKD